MRSARYLFFSKRHETTAEGSPSQESLEKEGKSRNKLRKQPPSRCSQRTTVADLELLMGNKSSRLDNVPRPIRPPRPSVNELPDLPSLPIYKAITYRHSPTILKDDFSDEKSKPKIPAKSPSRQTSISSRRPSFTAPEWPFGDNAPRGRPSSRVDQITPRKLYSCSADTAVRVKQRPPVYDRASHLAESYRALLPDPSDVESEHDFSLASDGATTLEPLPAPTPSHTHKWSWDPREPSSQSSHSFLRFSNRPLLSIHNSTTSTPQDSRLPTPRIPSWTGVGAGGPPLPRASSTASSSSFTAVEHDQSHTDFFAQARTSYYRHDSSVSHPGDTSSWGLKNDDSHYTYHQSDSTASYGQEHAYDAHPIQTSPSRISTTSRHLLSHKSSFSRLMSHPQIEPASQHQHQHQNQQRRRTSDDLGLQICGEMLSDQLRKTFLGENLKGDHESNKLQILLLIEAYEATLESCRKEVAFPPLTRGGEAEGQRKHHAREATRILDHWLGVLYGIYDDDFGGEDARETTGNGDMF